MFNIISEKSSDDIQNQSFQEKPECISHMENMAKEHNFVGRLLVYLMCTVVAQWYKHPGDVWSVCDQSLSSSHCLLFYA